MRTRGAVDARVLVLQGLELADGAEDAHILGFVGAGIAVDCDRTQLYCIHTLRISTIGTSIACFLSI